MKEIYIYLDDIRNAPKDGNSWNTVRSVSLLKSLIVGLQDTDCNIILSLDHDLGDDEETGYSFISWFESAIWNEELDIYYEPEIRIHSANPVGASKMQSAADSIARYFRYEKHKNEYGY